eukprot:m.89098 g.89098  ORF g.89098 m.89098 type:complete len:641 (+) comp36599_c0_seq5:165-2087(+)
MGKLKKKKKKTHRIQPTGLPSVADTMKDEQETIDTATADHSTQAHIVEKLSSPSADERQCACTGLASLVLETDLVPTLLDSGIVKRLGSLLVDDCEAVRLGAAGALRNLTLANQDTCTMMVEQDVMTSVVTLFKRSLADLSSCDSAGTAAAVDQTGQDLVEQALHLLWNLSECSSKAVHIFNSERLLPLVFHCLSPGQHSLTMSVTAAQCLHTVSEENPVLSEAVVDCGEMLTTLEHLLMCEGDSVHHMMLRVLAAGVLFNVHRHLPLVSQSQSMQAIARVLSKTLDMDVSAQMKAIAPNLASEDKIDKQFQPDKESDDVSDVKVALAAQQLALEILANFCCSDDSSDEGDCSDSDFDSEGEDAEQNGCGLEPMTFSLSADNAEAVINQSLPEKALSKCQFADPAVYQLLGTNSLGQKLIAKLNTVQSRALVALHNMLSMLDSEDLSHPDRLERLWLLLFNLAAGQSEKGGPSRSDEEFLEAVTSAMRSLAQRLQPSGHRCILPAQILRLASVCPTVAFASVRANIVGLLGVLGTPLAQQCDAVELLAAVGRSLCTAICDGDLWVVVEALDAVFDVFGDGDAALIVAKELQLLSKLQATASGFKKRVHSQRRSLGSRWPVAENVRTNLQRFVIYLKKAIS